VEALDPLAGWEGSLEHQGKHYIVGGVNHVLSLTVLGGGVGKRHSNLDSVREE
jgi:hypothetical protein